MAAGEALPTNWPRTKRFPPGNPEIAKRFTISPVLWPKRFGLEREKRFPPISLVAPNEALLLFPV